MSVSSVRPSVSFDPIIHCCVVGYRLHGLLTNVSFQSHGVLRNDKDGHDSSHEGTKLLPLVIWFFPLFGDHFGRSDVNEGAGHHCQHDGIDNRSGKLVDGHTDTDTDRTHGAEYGEIPDNVGMRQTGLEEGH